MTTSVFSLCSLGRAQRPALGLKVEVEDEGRPRSGVALKVSSVGGVLGLTLGVHAVNGDCRLQVVCVCVQWVACVCVPVRVELVAEQCSGLGWRVQFQLLVMVSYIHSC